MRHDDLDCVVGHIEAMIEARMEPYHAERGLLLQVAGIGVTAANIILAEIGVDMNVFPTPAHLAAWAGVCPGNRETGGKRISGATRKGTPTSPPSWWSAPWLPSGPKAATSARNTTTFVYASATNEP